jgi:hypothetical protein
MYEGKGYTPGVFQRAWYWVAAAFLQQGTV